MATQKQMQKVLRKAYSLGRELGRKSPELQITEEQSESLELAFLCGLLNWGFDAKRLVKAGKLPELNGGKQIGHICNKCAKMKGTGFCCIMLDLCPHKVWFKPTFEPCSQCDWKALRWADLDRLFKKVSRIPKGAV